MTAVTILALCGIGTATPAFASSPAVAPSPNSACPQGGTRLDTSSGGDVQIPFSGVPTFRDGPGGHLTVSKSYSGTAKYTGTVTGEVSVSDVLASAKLSVSASLETSNTTTATNTYDSAIPSGKYGNAQYVSYGKVIHWKHVQILATCAERTLSSGTVSFPSTTEGWHFWVTSS